MTLLSALGAISVWLIIGAAGTACMSCGIQKRESDWWALTGPLALLAGLLYCLMTRYREDGDVFRSGWRQ